MKTHNVFFVDFSGKEVTIMHSQCGSKAKVLESTVDSVGFSCPVCKIETKHFFIHAWAEVLAKLKKLPINGKLVVQKCYKVGEIMLSNNEVMVLEKREILK